MNKHKTNKDNFSNRYQRVLSERTPTQEDVVVKGPAKDYGRNFSNNSSNNKPTTYRGSNNNIKQ